MKVLERRETKPSPSDISSSPIPLFPVTQAYMNTYIHYIRPTLHYIHTLLTGQAICSY